MSVWVIVWVKLGGWGCEGEDEGRGLGVRGWVSCIGVIFLLAGERVSAESRQRSKEVRRQLNN
jgi:hypothetical protein